MKSVNIFRGIAAGIVLAIAALVMTGMIGMIYGEQIKEMQTDDVQLLIIPENQTKFVDETAEYKVIVKLNQVGFITECSYDNGLPFRVGNYEEYEKTYTYSVRAFGDATTKNYSHNLYCFYTDSTNQKYLRNITKSASVRFVGYPINFSVEISNKTYIDCEKPYGNITGKILNVQRESISCYYTKIYENGIETKETFSIPSPIQSHGTSEFYIGVNLDDIPKKINITCWNAHNESIKVVLNVPLNADLSTHKKIEKCENALKNLKTIADKEKINIDFSEVETKLSSARKYETSKGCIAAERYADECVIMLMDINKTITAKKEEIEKENAMSQNNENLKANASACIDKLRAEILNLTSLPYGNKTAIFANSAYDMLKTAEKNFAEEKYIETILSCQAGEEDVNMALKVYEGEMKEEENL